MRKAWFAVGILALFLVPSAMAQTDAERDDACLFPDFEVACDLAMDARFDEMFPGFADLMLFIVADVVAVLVVVALVWVLGRVRPFPTLRFKTEERVREVEPGGRVGFSFELENLRTTQPVEVLLERPSLPGYWDAELTAAQELESGFRVPHQLGEEGMIHLSSKRAGGQRARLRLSIKAPGDTSFEETLDYSLRAIPVLDGRVKKGKAKTAKVTVLVSPKVPAVEIIDVTHDPARVIPGVPVETTVRVVNRGEKAAEGGQIVFYLNGNAVGSQQLPRLDEDGEETVQFVWTPAAGENRVRLAVE